MGAAVILSALSLTWRQPQESRYPIFDFLVEGNSRLSEPGIRAVSGLKTGQAASRADFDAACQRLMDTGLFRYVNYRYLPKTVSGRQGFALTLQVTEETGLQAASLDLPGLDEERVWEELRRQDPLIEKSIPGNANATAYYVRAIERFLRQQGRAEAIIQVTESDLASGRMSAVFRPAVLPRIAGVAFEGNQSIPSAVLQKALERVAISQDYTERTLRQLLDLNVRPLYEEHGRLRVRFPSLNLAKEPTGEGIVVTVAVEEGKTYTLGRVDLSGKDVPSAELVKIARFPQGRLANWKEISASLESIRQHLGRDGYLAAKVEVGRSFDEESSVVHLGLTVNKGRQFFFGKLQLTGLEPEAARQARLLWKLSAGSPMNEPYIGEYLRTLLPTLQGVKSVSRDLRVRPGTTVVDVIVSFR
jgi:outer membrane protein insertion porin family